ncbi:MAG: sulfatase-like hydrolase/transferase [Terrimonas sp.]|nr:sulfatase-like hydrolase/transferase [Terrimonas sp.]
MVNQFCFTSLLLLLALLPPAKEKSSGPKQPNIIIIFMDDMAWGDISVNNPAINYTPHFSWLASRGVQLTNFYVSQSVCTASRASLLTGCYANRIGLSGAISHESKIGLDPEETTIADMLKEGGYHTAVFGKWHLGFQKKFLPVNQGFDEFYGIPYSSDMWPYHPERPGTYPPLPLYENDRIIDTIEEQSWMTNAFTDRAIRFIDQNRNHPFFLYLAPPLPHVPLSVSEKGKGFTGKGLYADVIHELDASIGKVLKSLSENNLEENTLVIVTSDNGPWLAYGNHAGNTAGLREGKGTSFEGGVREPCVLYWKGVLPAGKVFDQPAMTIDLLPTIAAITGSSLPERKIDGINIWPYLSGSEKGLDERPLFFYYHKNDLESMRWKNWKLYFPHTYRSMQGQLPGKDGIPGVYKYFTIKNPELYNLATDPFEKENVADGNGQRVKNMERMAEQIRQQLGDDLTGRSGKENRPPGTL